MKFDELLRLPQFSLPQQKKEEILATISSELTIHHQLHCPPYAKILRTMFPDWQAGPGLVNLPFFPVSLFKTHELKSIAEGDIFKTLQSSGTTGQMPSRIILDRTTAQRQTMALSRIMTHVLGQSRLPMILIEPPSLIQDRHQFNARVAGVLGMMNFGRNHFYALNDDYSLNVAGLREFLKKFGQAPFLIFGFTFLVWQYFFHQLAATEWDLSKGILVHSGGWKKLQELAVDNQTFRNRFRQHTGLERIYNFYGMVEQVGSVFLEGDDGYLYPPNFADILIRDPETFAVLPPGKPGLIQVISVLPLSYPGHSLLTEDLGIVHHIDGATSDRKGKAFSVLGRLSKAELRGCSDVAAVKHSS